MTIQTKTENRKALVKAVSEFTGEEQTYMGPPTFAYKVGELTIDRNGVITSESEEGCEELKSFLTEHGFPLIACEQTTRVCHMMELDPKYYDVIIKRWETLTEQKAVLLDE